MKKALYPGTFDPVTNGHLDLIDRALELFDGLVVDYVQRKHVRVVIRGLRMISDFEYEFQMALTNRKLNAQIETIFLMPSENYAYLSSRLIKEAGSLGARLSDFVPAFVEKRLKEKFGRL